MRRPELNDLENLNIPSKANVVLNLILLALIIMAVRAWHLAVIQYDEKFEESKKPQRKVVVEPSKRGTIRDRFNLPLALNQIQYQAAVVYSPLRMVPAKRGKRKEYITQLSQLLAKELGLSAERLEDLIYAKAAFYGNVPYVIKENITEKEYYRLKMLEKDWLGIQVQIMPKRIYPKGKVGADIIGYMGSINRDEYEKIIHEKKGLQDYLTAFEAGEDFILPEPYQDIDEVYKRFKDLEEMAYTKYDYVGKSGIEGRYEQDLRGFQGRKVYYTDSKNNFLRESNSREPLSGQRLLLSISSELQEYAESLLEQNEQIRETRISASSKSTKAPKEPWIKGGAIVAMDPSTGEILALASYPSYDPNDFIGSNLDRQKRSNIGRWFENEAYLAEIWNQQKPLERPNEKVWLTWDTYLSLVLAKDSELLKLMQEHTTIAKLINLQQNPPNIRAYDKNLILDLSNLAVDTARFSPDLLKKTGKMTINAHRESEGALTTVQDAVKNLVKELFHEVTFAEWRKENEQAFLKEKRLEEKNAKKYPRPYIDHLDEMENKFFAELWNDRKWEFIQAFIKGSDSTNDPYLQDLNTWNQELTLGAHQGLPWHSAFQKLKDNTKSLDKETFLSYLKTLRGFDELNRPLIGRYKHMRKDQGQMLEKHLAMAFYPVYGYGYGRSQAYRQATTQGSIFKLVTAYCALKQSGKNNPLNMVDQVFKIGNTTYVGYDQQGKPIPQIYKGGRVPRSHQYNLGQMDLVKAIECSSNPYFALLAGDIIEKPDDLVESAKEFGYGAPTGLDLPGEIKGKLPHDLNENKTGLYATSIGQHTLVVTPVQTAVMLSSIANKGKILKPQIISMKAGLVPERDLSIFNTYTDKKQKQLVQKTVPYVIREVPMSPSVRKVLLEGMRRVVVKTQAESIWNLSKMYKNHPEAISDYVDLKTQLIGKTSTSEAREYIDLDSEQGNNMYTHVWFGGIAFEEGHVKRFDNPELVVVVYLKYGGYGKEAAPVAAQIVKKWREIKAKNM